MENLLSIISIKVNEKIYIKDPTTSDLGRKIISGSIDMIEDMGFECFTFRKLALAIHSTEASIYRYFESKHKLLLYLISWYWGWMEYRMVFATANINDPEKRLENAINLLTQDVKQDSGFAFINETKLHHIVISESSKAYLTKEVDQENKEGFFAGYKALVARVSTIISEINPEYRYPNMLVSTVIEGSHHERYFAAHLPRLTDQVQGEDSISTFYRDIVFKAIT